MNDLISKQTALDILEMIKGEVDDGDGFLYDRWKFRVQTLPSTMLVRCKDCKHYPDYNGGYPNDECKWRTDEHPFCSPSFRSP